MEGPPLGPGGQDITWPDQVAPRGRKASSTRKIKPQNSNLSWRRAVRFFGVSCVVCVCGAGGARAFVCCVRLWRLCSWRASWCVLRARGCVCGLLLVRLGACPRLSGLWLAALCGCGGCVLWSPATPGWDLVVAVCSPAAPFACPPPSFSWLRCLACCSPGALSGTTRAVVGVWLGWDGGGSLTLARVPCPGVSPWVGRCLHSPSGCNSVVRAVHLCPFRTNGPAPKPRPDTGVGYTVGRRGVPAGQACLLPAPMDSVPYPQSLAGPEPQYVP